MKDKLRCPHQCIYKYILSLQYSYKNLQVHCSHMSLLCIFRWEEEGILFSITNIMSKCIFCIKGQMLLLLSIEHIFSSFHQCIHWIHRMRHIRVRLHQQRLNLQGYHNSSHSRMSFQQDLYKIPVSFKIIQI